MAITANRSDLTQALLARAENPDVARAALEYAAAALDLEQLGDVLDLVDELPAVAGQRAGQPLTDERFASPSRLS